VKHKKKKVPATKKPVVRKKSERVGGMLSALREKKKKAVLKVQKRSSLRGPGGAVDRTLPSPGGRGRNPVHRPNPSKGGEDHSGAEGNVRVCTGRKNRVDHLTRIQRFFESGPRGEGEKGCPRVLERPESVARGPRPKTGRTTGRGRRLQRDGGTAVPGKLLRR